MAIKYTSEIEINLTRERIVALFNDPENLQKWQPGLKEIVHFSGEPGKSGAKTKLEYDMRGKKVIMEETIISNNLPEEISFVFKTNGVKNEQVNKFYILSEEKTKWESHNIFRFSGFMTIVAIFMKGAFKKQTLKFMNQFKNFAEGKKRHDQNMSEE